MREACCHLPLPRSFEVGTQSGQRWRPSISTAGRQRPPSRSAEQVNRRAL